MQRSKIILSAIALSLFATLSYAELCQTTGMAIGVNSGGSGNGNTTPTPQPPTSHPNLTIDFDILQNGTEKKAEYGHLLTATQDVTLTVKVCNNSSTDTTEGRVKGGSKTDTRFWVRLPGQGNWSDIGREETKDSNLTKGTCHIEKKSFTIPNNPGNTIAFRAKVDDRDEITESNEDDNQSRDEVFTIGAPQPPAYCSSLPQLRSAIASLQRDYDANRNQERYYRERENHYRNQYAFNKDKERHYDKKYRKYKKKHKKKHKSKYKRKYKKARDQRNRYRARAQRNKEKCQDADRKKNAYEAEKNRIKAILNHKRHTLADRQRNC